MLLKKIYFALPGKLLLFRLIRQFISPSVKISGYLKFKGRFKLYFEKSNFVYIHNDNSTLPSILFWKGTEGYEKSSIDIWLKMSKNSKVIFDIGANFGLFGLIAQKANPISQVYFFEPIQRNSERINKNIQLNNFKCKSENLAVSGISGKAVFYDMNSSENTIGSFSKEFVLKHKHHKEIIPIEVNMTSIDDYMESNNVNQLDLLKIDVEGVEYDVLVGSKKTLEKYHPTILIEISDVESLLKINEFIQSLNFTYFYYEIDEFKHPVLIENLINRNHRNFLFKFEKLT